MKYFFVCVYLTTVEAQPRLLAMCEHLPEGDSKHPCVCSMGERSSLKTLWSAPVVRKKNTHTHTSIR